MLSAPNKASVFIAVMLPKISLAVALLGLCFPCSNFAAVLSVPPAAGGEGIQSALDRLSSGGEVDLSAGQYLIREPVLLRNDHQTLRGCGPATVLYLADGANCPLVVLGSPFAVAKAPVKNVRLADLFIDGNRKNQQKEVWRVLSDGAGVYNNGVDVWGVDGAEVEHVVCCRCRSGGMVTSAQTRRLMVRDYTAFDNQFDGLACYLTEDSDFRQLNLHDNLSAGISLDLSFNHNVIHDSVLTDNDLGIFMRQSRNNVFEGLTIQKSRHHGVFMAQTFVGTAAGWQSCPGSECTGNTFNHLVVTRCGGKGFLVNDVTCTNNVICGGQFADDAQGGLVQAAPNLVTLQDLAGANDAARLDAAMPLVHQLPGHVPAAQAAAKVF
jgi:parallel beta-helix repeat protein